MHIKQLSFSAMKVENDETKYVISENMIFVLLLQQAIQLREKVLPYYLSKCGQEVMNLSTKESRDLLSSTKLQL